MSFNLLMANSSGSLDNNKEKINRAFERATQTSKILLKLDNVDVVCIADKNQVIPEIGIGGFTPNRHLIYLYIAPDKSVEEDEIYNTLCHELHHARRYDGPGYGTTLFDSLIFEGLAEAFENEVSSGKAFVPSTLRKRRNTRQLIANNKKSFQDTDFNYHQWFIKDVSGRLPRWAGYEMGYSIVRDYLTSQNKKASDFVVEDTKTFLNNI